MPSTSRPIAALTASFAALFVTACSAYTSPAPVNYSQADITDYIMAAVLSPARPPEDMAQDNARRPEETVAFAGVQRGDVIAQIAPADGYYTRILSQTVGAQGKIFALVPASQAQQPEALAIITGIAEQYGNVEVIVVDAFDTVSLPQPVDLVWAVDAHRSIGGDGMDTVSVWASGALKPGGIFFLKDGSGVREDITSTGLALEAESGMNGIGGNLFDTVAFRFRKSA